MDRSSPIDGGRIDLHSHSRASDGQYAPAEVAERVAGAGLAVWALSDHDTVAGVDAAAEVAGRLGVRLVPGIELSAFLDRVYSAHDFDAAVLGTPGDLGLGYLEPLARLSGLPLPEHPRISELLSFYQDAMPVAFLYHARGVQGVNRRLEGVQLGLRGELATVSHWSLKP